MAVLAVAFLFASFLSQPARAADCRPTFFHIIGTSLTPRYQDNAMVKGRLGDCAQDIRRGSLIVFRAGHTTLIKIAVGVPGDRFSLRQDSDAWNLLIDGKVEVNSEQHPYRFSGNRHAMLALYAKDYHGVIPPDAFLVLGDGVTGTEDSTRLGLIDRKDIIGIAP